MGVTSLLVGIASLGVVSGKAVPSWNGFRQSPEKVRDESTSGVFYNVRITNEPCPPPCVTPQPPTISVAEGQDPNSPANAWYDEGWQDTGINFLQITTTNTVDSRKQAYYAGLLEGYATANLLAMWWGKDIIYPDPNVVPGEKKFVNDNLEWMHSMIANHSATDPWWYQAQLILDQLQGLTDGYMLTNPAKNMTFADVYWSTLSAGDLDDLPCVIDVTSPACRYVYLPSPVHEGNEEATTRVFPRGLRRKPRHPPFSHCTGMIKLTENNQELFVGHGVWDDYNSMIRITKKYDFAFQQTSNPNSPLIPATGHLFSSYPGVLISGDDFWVTSLGLVMISSEIGPTPDSSIYKGIVPVGTRWEFMRQIIAARLSSTPAEFAKYWSVQNSGTFNSEWYVVDYKSFWPGQPLKPNSVWYMAQAPTLIVTYDVTHQLSSQGYLGTWNIPSDAKIYNVSGWPAMVQEKLQSPYGAAYAALFNYNENPRAKIAKRDHSGIFNITDMQKFMRYNEYTTDPLSQGPGTPAASPWNAIMARPDLVNGTYPDELHADCFGGNDGKVVDSQLVRKMSLNVIVGPTADSDDTPVFSFADAGDLCNENDYPHDGLPDTWNFDWQQPEWQLDALYVQVNNKNGPNNQQEPIEVAAQ